MKVKILLVCCLFVLSAFVALWIAYENVFTESVIIEQSLVVEINKGDSLKRISDKLFGKQITMKSLWFKLIAYKNKASTQLKAGEYEFKAGQTIPEILAILVAGKSKQYSITFLEGWTFKQMYQKIQHNPQLKKTLEEADFQNITARLGTDYKHPEGLFFPDTYFFDKETTDFALLKTAYHKMNLVLNQEWKQRDLDLPLKNSYQALTLASIIEKESGKMAEQARISGVFIRRLKKRMLLQADTTVIYGMGDDYQGNISKQDLRRPTAYNTYVIRGLPPTPIAMPGIQSIRAALHPTTEKSLYFVARGDGSHFFSTTLREHNNAVNKYQKKQWKKVNSSP